MRTLHLFAGAGGGILADLILGHEPVAAVELDPYACAVLRERFPGLSVIEGDIRGVDFRELAHVDAICAGFPCQDISTAGKGAGLEGARSSLFFEVMRAVDVIRPRYVFLENSPAIRTRGRTRVTAELVARGYRWRDGILAAADVGAPHIRKRWWLLAMRTDREWDVADAHIDACGAWRTGNPDKSEERGDVDRGSFDAHVADSDGARLEERQSIASDDGEECETIVGANWWSSEPGMDRVVDGLPNRTHRIRNLGNAQVPLVAALAWRLLNAY